MKKNYLVAGFEKTLAERFPAQAETLQQAMFQRMDALRADYAGASKELWRHLEGQIIPGIAIYETLQTVLPKDEALQLVHGYVEQRAWRIRAVILRLVKFPGLYRKVPGIFAKGVDKMFGASAGFTAVQHDAGKDAVRFDMVRCPYHTACVKYGCPELCPCFCDSDDITYDDMHPDLLWHRTKTLGRGDDCCDFGLSLRRNVP